MPPNYTRGKAPIEIQPVASNQIIPGPPPPIIGTGSPNTITLLGQSEQLQFITPAAPARTEVSERIRVWANVDRYAAARLIVHVLTVGASGAQLVTEFATTPAGPWYNLGATVSLAALGTIVGPAIQLPANCVGDVLVRTSIEGGNGAASPEIGNLYLEFAGVGSRLPSTFDDIFYLSDAPAPVAITTGSYPSQGLPGEHYDFYGGLPRFHTGNNALVSTPSTFAERTWVVSVTPTGWRFEFGGKWVSPPLAAQTFPAQLLGINYSISVTTGRRDANYSTPGNGCQAIPHLYIWRPSTDAMVSGPTSNQILGSQDTIVNTGLPIHLDCHLAPTPDVTVLAGDVLVFELSITVYAPTSTAKNVYIGGGAESYVRLPAPNLLFL